ncbi:hypothetical protein K458DRAFT_385672 [Lentithecium fluviatile CBS 122367]|uniref:Uncharacterized protein n=1 Tax=Lentithecium fluviatile CBS 122367 TaxID=1168545 RepID=A0A6G1JC43_9PLEO|nr:hypothetical protein K458DRAFT_385672 [Lentithecium fluviatile CBS 122367]
MNWNETRNWFAGGKENEIDGTGQHYSAFGNGVRSILDAIVEDMSTYSNLHNWDDRMINRPTPLLKAACREYMRLDSGRLDALSAFVHATEVLTYQGESHLFPAITRPENLEQNIFFTFEPHKETSLPKSLRIPQPDLRRRVVQVTLELRTSPDECSDIFTSVTSTEKYRTFSEPFFFCCTHLYSAAHGGLWLHNIFHQFSFGTLNDCKGSTPMAGNIGSRDKLGKPCPLSTGVKLIVTEFH